MNIFIRNGLNNGMTKSMTENESYKLQVHFEQKILGLEPKNQTTDYTFSKVQPVELVEVIRLKALKKF